MMSMRSIPSHGFFLKLLMFAWLVSASEAENPWPEGAQGWARHTTSWFSEGKPSWCQAEPGSCVGRRHTYKKPTEIVLADSATIHDIRRWMDWDGDGDLDFVATYNDKVHGLDNYLEDGLLHLGFFECLGNDTFRIHDLMQSCLDAVETRMQGTRFESSRLPSHYESLLHFEVADWDGDGDMDVLAATYVNESLVVSWANRTAAMGHGEVQQITMIVADDLQPADSTPTRRNFLRSMKVVDWDLDGDADLILGARYFERVDPETVIERIGGQNPLNIWLPDMLTQSEISKDVDDHLKMVIEVVETTEEYRQLSYRSFKHAMNGAFVEQVEHPLQDLWVGARDNVVISLADWNSDGLPDLLVWRWPNKLTYYECTQEGNLAEDPHTTLYDDIEIDDSCQEMHVVDWNGDGFQDVLTYCRSQFQLYQFDGKKFWEVFGVFENVTCNPTCSIAISDWDGDGDVDMILTSISGHVHYHEMIDGRFWKEQIQHPFFGLDLIVDNDFNWLEIRFPQPLAVDWDNDGDVDLILGPPDFRYFERLDNGSLSEWSREESPFLIVLSEGLSGYSDQNVGWRFLDCDSDGDLDLVLVQQSFYSGTYFHVCEHTDKHGLRCDDHILCLGTNLSNFHSEGGPLGPHGRLFGWDFGTTRNGQLEVLTVHRNKILPWRAGVCVPTDPCHQKGVCLHGKTSCSCIQGHELADCSGCQPHFYSVDMSRGKAHGCEACPGEGAKVCHDRGRCFDDIAAKNASKMATAAQMARGNGSCLCSEDSFYGIDEQGRSTCAEGNCPRGTEETNGICLSCQAGAYSLAGGVCKKCGPGTKSSTGSSACERCPPGTISQGSGNSDCKECPAGKYEVSRQWCNDCPSGSLSPAGNHTCAKCPEGFYATLPGSSVCDPCPAGTYAEGGSTKCILCSSGKYSGVGSSACSLCGVGMVAGEAGSAECELCPAGTYAEAGSSKCLACSAGTISGAGSGNCSRCASGHFAKASVACEACPGGTFAIEGSCRSCPSGHVSGPASALCSSCNSVLIRRTPDPAKQTCHVAGLEVVLALICWLTSAGCCFWCFSGFYVRMPIADISRQGQKVVVTTSIAHQILKSKKARKVSFHDTGVPDLEQEPWKVSALSSFQLTLHAEQDNFVDTSMGTLRLKFPFGFLATGFWHCPTICWCLLSLAATVAIMSQLTWSLTLLLCGLGFLSGLATFAFRRRRGQLKQSWGDSVLGQTIFV